MQLIRKGDSRVSKIAEKNNLRADRRYRLSGFAEFYENGGVYLLKNTLTKRLYRLEKDEYEALASLQGTSAPLSFLTERGLEPLAINRFVVEEDYDETAHYRLVLSVMRTLGQKKPGVRGYTILPTTACNARCVYCYEEGIRAVTMTEATADAVVEFITRTRWDGTVTLHWFGGEPLAAPGTVSRICRALTERDVRFTSTIITNGTLLTPALADEAAEVWKLKTAQVSLDGARADYEARKRYLVPERHNYDAAMEAVRLFTERGVRVTLRCNYDEENLPRLRELYEDLHARFAGNKNVRVYSEQLFQSSHGERGGEIYRLADREDRRIDELGLHRVIRRDERLRTSYCMADAGKGSVLIDPEGGLHRCEHNVGAAPEGTIFDDVLDWEPPETRIKDECRGCMYLPVCTPFYKDGCPGSHLQCKLYRRIEAERYYERICAGIAEKENRS